MEQTLSSAIQESGWAFAPSILIGLAVLTLAYALAANPALRPGRLHGKGARISALRQLAFYAGTLVVFLALCSPLDGLGDEYLFSAHMLQHLLLTLVAAPLWLLGIPAWLYARLFPRGRVRWAASAVIAPLPAFILYNGVMLGWHVPAAYDLALEHEWVHILEHLMFIGSALIGWAPALVPAPINRQSDLIKALYLAFTILPCTALAALLTLTNVVLYPFYLSAPSLLGLNPLRDQQFGGLLMWLPSDIILMAPALYFFSRWFNQQVHGSVQA